MAAKKKYYIDLFSGCGGFSLGLGNAGWEGLFAVEKDPMAFETFKYNLIDGEKYGHFSWPDWLPQKSTTIQTLLNKYTPQLKALRGKVELIAGGPPCQGFSMAGQRKSDDPRNKLSGEYIKVVGLVKPKFVVLENVRGFNAAFKDKEGVSNKVPYSMVVKGKLEGLGYTVFHDYVHSEKFGVPQSRTRFLMIGVRSDLIKGKSTSPFEILSDLRLDFLKEKGLPKRLITVKDAISDLELSQTDAKLVYHSGSQDKGFKKLEYKRPEKLSSYVTVMRKGLNGTAPTSMRIARHREETKEQFIRIQKTARPGIVLSKYEKEELGIKKQAICVLDATKPSKTLTTLPDDLLHYSEPRILTVRESARLQSFPDDFVFKGKYTTGGQQRTKECPRYTQVGNAVPPLVGEILGITIKKLLRDVER
jgi:DNA (cytosine-5)-methyltransferase 1